MSVTCPPDIAEILLDLLFRGLLACRDAGNQGRADWCAIHADHLHNLPGLLARYSPELLRNYWEVERPSFARRCDPVALSYWETAWARLRLLVEAAIKPTAQA